MHFKPTLADGRSAAPLSWQLLLWEYVCNILIWPLKSTASKWIVILQYVYIVFSNALCFFLHYSNIYFFILAYPDVLEIASCLTTYIAFNETHIRILHMSQYRQRFKQFLQHFYTDVFVDAAAQPQIFKKVRLKIRLVNFVCICYLVVYFLFVIVLIHDWSNGVRGLMFRQAYPYDYRPLSRYVPHMLLNFWIGIMTVSQFIGETYLFANSIMHLDGSYQLLASDVLVFAKKLETNDKITRNNVAKEFQRGMLTFIKRNGELNRFVGELEEMFTFRLFVSFSLSSLLFCVLLLNLLTIGFNWQNLHYVMWSLAKLIELFVIGEFGSTLNKTTANISEMYYQSNWEVIVHKSSDSGENVCLMKLMLMAMQVNSRPMSISGLKFFEISIGTVLKIIHAAFSYYTFLSSVK